MPSDAVNIGSDESRRRRDSFWSSTPIARSSLQYDLYQAHDDDNATHAEEDDDDEDAGPQPPAMRGSSTSFHGHSSVALLHHRPSIAGAGSRATIFTPAVQGQDNLSKVERERVLEEEQCALRYMDPTSAEHTQDPQSRRTSVIGANEHLAFGDRRFSRRSGAASDTTPLLGDFSGQSEDLLDPTMINKVQDEAIAAGILRTTWQREAKIIGKHAMPLILTFLLQYSLTMASVFTVGHIGSVELGAVSLAAMSANITGFAIYQGLATSLDTLCAQAYGSGHRKLVGLQVQRMCYFLWAVTIPIGIIWLNGTTIIALIVPEPKVAELAGQYLKVILLGAPGFAAFEAGKRYVQAQGLFSASLYVLLFCAPFNAFLNWLLVWYFRIGFVGAPIAVAITDNLLPIGLMIYVRFFSDDGMLCWGGFTKKATQNWSSMIRLALPGVIMIEAECLAFEILTFAASYFGTRTLAAQSVLATVANLAFQVPFPLSVAGSTRVANLIGADLAGAAKITARVTFSMAVVLGLINATLLGSLRNLIPLLFTDDRQVIGLISAVLPLCAAFQLFDALVASCNGILRGLGRQHFGGYVQLLCYYGIAMPISFGTAFGLGWKLQGLWTGVAITLGLIVFIESVYLCFADWEKSVEDAKLRNLDF